MEYARGRGVRSQRGNSLVVDDMKLQSFVPNVLFVFGSRIIRLMVLDAWHMW
jgi:hypothetical protein